MIQKYTSLTSDMDSLGWWKEFQKMTQNVITEADYGLERDYRSKLRFGKWLQNQISVSLCPASYIQRDCLLVQVELIEIRLYLFIPIDLETNGLFSKYGYAADPPPPSEVAIST